MLAVINTIFVQESAEAASAQWCSVTDQLRPKLPKVADMMVAAENEVLPFMSFSVHAQKRLSPWEIRGLASAVCQAAPAAAG
ncbi:transposase-like protein [Duganella sp. SG902]|uniref:transposase n=1 Tax=Duganella sp. SG902 TaxID=2587016 RepID=UPI00159E6BED|nr:transposase-like protein [Duganella sp. SG902]